MQSRRPPSIRKIAALVFASALALAIDSFATENVLYNFQRGNDGRYPVGNLVFDRLGNVYGTTSGGGIVPCGDISSSGCGTVFELTPNSSGGWTESVLYRFAGRKDGAVPAAGLTIDSSGNLYGTTYYGGENAAHCPSSCGTVFKLAPVGGNWIETVLYRFTGHDDGYAPAANVVLDKAGNLFGTTTGAGKFFGGVFELTPNSEGGWTESTLHGFTGNFDGSHPNGLTIDGSGNLYGTTVGGGIYNDGVVFKLTPASGSWTETILHEFTGGDDGSVPLAQLTINNGNLYGTTQAGGADTLGTAFMLTPARGNWTMHLIHTFTGANDGARPESARLFVDSTGTVYGTAHFGGFYQFGVVFKLVPQSSGEWVETVLYNFTGGADGGYPFWGVIERSGNLYGGLGAFGSDHKGLIFQLTP